MSCAYPSELESIEWEDINNCERGIRVIVYIMVRLVILILAPIWGPLWLLGCIANKLGIHLEEVL